jgi:hypothetical protein
MAAVRRLFQVDDRRLLSRMAPFADATIAIDSSRPDYVGFARWYYRRRHFLLYHIIWPNNDGHYPWSPNASTAFKEWQPALGKAPTDA